jgi:two-component sensor histidine kinase
MNRTYLFLLSLYLVFTPYYLTAEENQYVEIADSLRSEIVSNLSAGKLDSAQMKSMLLMDFAIQNKLPVYQGKANLILGQVFSASGLADSAIYYFLKADSIFLLTDEKLMAGQANARTAITYKRQGNPGKAITYYLKALEYVQLAGDTIWMGNINDGLGHVYLETGNYYKSLEHFQKAIIYFTAKNRMTNVGVEYNSLGLIYRKMKNTQEEKQSYIDAIEILSSMDESVFLAYAYNNLSELYLDEGKIDEGLEMLEKARQIYLNIGNESGLCNYYAVLAYHYQNINPPDYAKVIEYASKGANIAFETEQFRYYADATYFLGEAYLQSNQLSLAREILEKGRARAEEYNYLPELERIILTLSKVYKRLNKHAQALDFLEQHLALKDSLSNEERVKEFTQLDLSFRFKQEQYQDSIMQAQQKRELLFQHASEIQGQQTRQLILVFILIILFLAIVSVFYYARRRKAQSLILDSKNKLIEQSLHEKELLLKEIHHRVKNNFQTISSLLDLQSKGLIDEQAKHNIKEGQSRIQSMAMIHQKLYQNKDLSVVDMQDYIAQLSQQIASTHGHDRLDISVDANDCWLDIDTAIPLGLILNELITNACKYAFKPGENGKLEISLKKIEKGVYQLIHQDSGKGLAPDIDLTTIKSLGLRLVQRLTRQLQGTFNYSQNNACRFEIVFKDREARKKVE